MPSVVNAFMVSTVIELKFRAAADGSRYHPLLSSCADVREAQNVQAARTQG